MAISRTKIHDELPGRDVLRDSRKPPEFNRIPDPKDTQSRRFDEIAICARCHDEKQCTHKACQRRWPDGSQYANSPALAQGTQPCLHQKL
jgi:hypothetical protein